MNNFEIENGVLIRYHGDDNHVTVPEDITEIGSKAFAGCSTLRRVTLPESMLYLRADAFKDCTALEMMTLPEHLASIEYTSFQNCPKLKCQYLGYTVSAEGLLNISGNPLMMIKAKDYSAILHNPSKACLIAELYLSSPDEAELLEYIQENFERIFALLLCMQDRDILESMIKSGYLRANQNIEEIIPYVLELLKKLILSGQFIHKENIDLLIQEAIEQKAYTIQLLLMDYKAHRIGYDDIDQIIGKKFKL